MRLYPKKLRGIEDLEREKALLKMETRELDSEDLFSLEGLLGKSKSSDGEKVKSQKSKEGERNDEGGFDLFSLLEMLPIANPLISMALGFVKTKVVKAGVNTGKNAILKLGKEVMVGYLKWKAIELSAKGVSKIIKKRREKRAAERL